MLVRVQNALTIMDNSIVVIQNIENRVTLQTNNSTSKNILKITKSRVMNTFGPITLFTVATVRKKS